MVAALDEIYYSTDQLPAFEGGLSLEDLDTGDLAPVIEPTRNHLRLVAEEPEASDDNSYIGRLRTQTVSQSAEVAPRLSKAEFATKMEKLGAVFPGSTDEVEPASNWKEMQGAQRIYQAAAPRMEQKGMAERLTEGAKGIAKKARGLFGKLFGSRQKEAMATA